MVDDLQHSVKSAGSSIKRLAFTWQTLQSNALIHLIRTQTSGHIFGLQSESSSEWQIKDKFEKKNNDEYVQQQ